MSSQSQIGAPFVLASLPRPNSTTSGRTQAAGVYSISGAKKRKRAELAVAVDGEGILIYSLQNPQLVTSYALPPHTSFATSPYCLYRKGNSKRPSIRYTYAATTQSTSGEMPQILCFIEETHRDGTAETAKSTHAVTGSGASSDVIAIETTPGAGDFAKENSHNVLVTFANGDVHCLSPDLQALKWQANLGKVARGIAQASNDGFETLHVTITTAKAAVGGLLRNRQDIAAILDPPSEGASNDLDLTAVVCAVWKGSDNVTALSLFHIQPSARDLVTTRGLPIKHLLTWELPTPATPLQPQANYYIHASSGMVYQLADGRLISYDFSGTVPKINSDFRLPGSVISSFVRVAPNLMLTSTEHSIGVFDTKYESMQSLLTLGDKQALSNESKKRKLEDGNLPDHSDSVPKLVAYFGDSGLAVGVSGHELVGIQVAESASRKKPRFNDTLLIDAVGKGVSRRSSHTTHNSESQEWEKKSQKLDKYASKGKVADFEEQFAAHLGIELEDVPVARENGVKPPATDDKPATSSLTNSVSEAGQDNELRRWKLPKAIPESGRSRFRACAMFALRKIFDYVAAEPTSKGESRRPSLKIKFFPPNVFEWLLLSGYVTKESISRAFKDGSANETAMAATLVDGDIIKSIVQFDPELHILSAILNHRQYLPVGEVVQAIRVLMQSLDDRTETPKVAGLLTDGKAPTGDDMDVDLASELDAATHDLDHAMSVLDNGLVVRSHNLRPALIRLHTFSPTSIASTLRSMLPRRELESLIRLLHTELRNGGWTSPYDFLDSEMTTPEDPDDQAVAIIASLLGCALDAIGAGAWLASIGNSASEESSEDIIQELLRDTSEALNGFWEARFMRGLLSEFLRYATNLPKSHKPSKKIQEGKPYAVDLAPEDSLPMLPLGGKVDLGVEKTKTGKGGKKEERSAREIGMLISKRVPKYSVEKIVL